MAGQDIYLAERTKAFSGHRKSAPGEYVTLHPVVQYSPRVFSSASNVLKNFLLEARIQPKAVHKCNIKAVVYHHYH